jgi:hypothetical protein
MISIIANPPLPARREGDKKRWPWRSFRFGLFRVSAESCVSRVRSLLVAKSPSCAEEIGTLAIRTSLVILKLVAQLIIRAEGFYDVQEGEFGTAYRWHPEYIVECSCSTPDVVSSPL